MQSTEGEIICTMHEKWHSKFPLLIINLSQSGDFHNRFLFGSLLNECTLVADLLRKEDFVT